MEFDHEQDDEFLDDWLKKSRKKMITHSRSYDCRLVDGGTSDYTPIMAGDALFWVSDIDVKFVLDNIWSVEGRGYVFGPKGALHRILLDAPESMLIDHMDGNPRNCSRTNIRLCNSAQNVYNADRTNRTGFTGVKRYLRSDGKTVYYDAIIKNEKKFIFLGSHETAEGAARAYDEKCLELRGEFAWLNFNPKGRVQSGSPTDEFLRVSTKIKSFLASA